MTDVQIGAYVDEFERRWRSRTPASTIEEALPHFRVGRGEMRNWVNVTFGVEIEFDDVDKIHRAMVPLWKRLQREFPSELWQRKI